MHGDKTVSTGTCWHVDKTSIPAMPHLVLLLCVCCLWNTVRVCVCEREAARRRALLTYFPSCSEGWPASVWRVESWRSRQCCSQQWWPARHCCKCPRRRASRRPACAECVPGARVSRPLLWLLLSFIFYVCESGLILQDSKMFRCWYMD